MSTIIHARFALAVLLLGLQTLGLPNDASAVERYSLTLEKPHRPGDRGEITLSDEQLQVKILSSTGIGKLKLHRSATETSWPQTIVVLLQYASGDPLSELEGFTLRGESNLIQGSRRTSDAMDHFILTDEGTKFQNLPARKAKIRVSRTKEAMRVEIPGKLLSEETKIEIQWIDYYRT
ncbi:hypothetical protein [Novipirellula caenicola]|uniref:Uncharacterized protein n=1 Tax=Novipirellula caenicola TaxID=1536901 RepID=A0ABP9VYN0_9BACT